MKPTDLEIVRHFIKTIESPRSAAEAFDRIEARVAELEGKANDAVMGAAILDWVMDALAGHEVCDFAESFVEVAAALAARGSLEAIKNGCGDPAGVAQGTLNLLGNSE